jgi:CTP-dependent riboflavin kinase
LAFFLPAIKFVGAVSTGQGRGKFFTKLPWVIRQMEELTGVTPYHGTLNLHLTSECMEQRALLTRQNGVMIKPESGYLIGYLYKAMIFDTNCFVVLPDVPNYQKDLLEIIAAENLRDVLNVKDGDILPVIVTV